MQFQAHVDDVDPRQLQGGAFARPVSCQQLRSDALRQREQADVTLLGPPEGLDGRRRAAQDQHRAHRLRQVLGNRSRVVARHGILLVGRVVLLVEDDQSHVRGRREERGARSDHHRIAPGGDSLPGGVALRVGKAGVEHRHPVAEAGGEPVGDLRRQGDLRHEHERRFAVAKAPGGGAQIELGFPAAGDSVEQERSAVLGLEGAFDRGPGDGLRRGQLRNSVLTAIRHGHMQTLDSLHFLDNALADQCGERGAVRSGLTQDVRFENEPTGVPGRETGAPSQRGDDRFLRGSATQRGRIGLVDGGESTALCAASAGDH